MLGVREKFRIVKDVFNGEVRYKVQKKRWLFFWCDISLNSGQFRYYSEPPTYSTKHLAEQERMRSKMVDGIVEEVRCECGNKLKITDRQISTIVVKKCDECASKAYSRGFDNAP
jgi:hypothetical protein